MEFFHAASLLLYICMCKLFAMYYDAPSNKSGPLMNHELVFSIAGMLSMLGWITLLVSPWIPTWSDRIAGLVIPATLSVGYLATLLLFWPDSGGFGSFAEVQQLFMSPDALMAGWVHFLAFDLVVGAWICRTARQENIRFWFVLPCLPLTFLFGPVGFLLFSVIRPVAARRPG
jgi:hypothetical protein